MRTLKAPAFALIPALLLSCLETSARGEDMKSQTLERVKHATVMVFTAASERGKGDRPLGSGSGFFVNSTGLLITNNHVVDPTHGLSEAQKQRLHYAGGRLTWTVVADAGTSDEKKYECMVLYQNENADQAIAQAFDSDGKMLQTPKYLKLQPESRLTKRSKVWALGFPGGDAQRTAKDKHAEVSVTAGNVIDIPRTPAGRIRRVYTDVIARPGNSGGPMVDADGFLVGTVTLMTKPEGREDTGGANYSALVPAKLSADMIQNAFSLAKLHEGSDLTPFVGVLTNADRRISLPGFDRLTNKEAVFFENGDRVYGEITTPKITWESPLGTLDVPAEAVAYVMSNRNGSNLFLEGGNQISASKVTSKFQFKPDGGSPNEQSFGDTTVVAFRTGGRTPEPVEDEVIILDSDVCYLVLESAEGTGRFETKAGVIDLPFGDISRIEAHSDDRSQQILSIRDGRRLTGKFVGSPFCGVIAATKTPIQLDLSQISRGTIETAHMTSDNVAGLTLRGVVASGDREVRQIAKLLEANEKEAAKARLKTLTVPETLRDLPTVSKEQVMLLDGVAMLREGDYEGASKGLKKLNKATDQNVAAYAQACVEVLKKYQQTYEGKPLSERGNFASAGAMLAKDYISDTRELLKDRLVLEGKTKSEFTRSVASVKKHEEQMKVAAVLGGASADDEMIRLWKFAAEVAAREIKRIDDVLKEKSQTRGSSGGRANRAGGGAQTAQQRELKELREDRDKATETFNVYQKKLAEYGFHIDDQDIQEKREGESDEPSPIDEP